MLQGNYFNISQKDFLPHPEVVFVANTKKDFKGLNFF